MLIHLEAFLLKTKSVKSPLKAKVQNAWPATGKHKPNDTEEVPTNYSNHTRQKSNIKDII